MNTDIFFDDTVDLQAQMKDFENQQYFNTLKDLPYMPYYLTKYLIENCELMWKLLKYDNADAWDTENLDECEKVSMIYKGTPTQNDFKVFFDEGQDDAWDKQVSVLRIFPVEIEPVSHTHADVYIAIQVMCHSAINHLSNYTTRVDSIIQNILEKTNGKTVDGVGRMVFDISTFPSCTISAIGKKPYVGKTLIMGIDYSNDEENETNEIEWYD